MVNRVGIIAGLVVTVRTKQFVTWVMMTMVAIWEHIVLLVMIWEDSNALESAAPIVI